MSLIVEDGTGLSNAESYVSVATCDAYHISFGNTGWTGLDSLKEAALRRATQYLDSHYRYQGETLVYHQALLWPRSLVWFAGVYMVWPVNRVVQACCELALRALESPLASDQDDRSILEETVGPITTKYGFPQFGGQVRYAIVDDLLRPLITGGTVGTVRLERA